MVSAAYSIKCFVGFRQPVVLAGYTNKSNKRKSQNNPSYHLNTTPHITYNTENPKLQEMYVGNHWWRFFKNKDHGLPLCFTFFYMEYKFERKREAPLACKEGVGCTKIWLLACAFICDLISLMLPLPCFYSRSLSNSKEKHTELGMAEHDEKREETFIEKVAEKLHHEDSSSSSDSDNDNKSSKSRTTSFSDKVNRLFGRQKPIHKVLGGGKPADVFMWRNKKVSAGVLGGATAIWVLFELLEYHLLTLVCHILILALAVLFLWSNACTFIKKSPPRIPEVHIPEEPILQVASALRIEINRAFAVLRDIASGRDLKKFLLVIAGLWALSIIGSCCNFLTLFYIAFVLLHTVPVFYDKYEDQVDAFGEKAWIEIKKLYAVFDAKVLSKIPRGPLKNKKKAQ